MDKGQTVDDSSWFDPFVIPAPEVCVPDRVGPDPIYGTDTSGRKLHFR